MTTSPKELVAQLKALQADVKAKLAEEEKASVPKRFPLATNKEGFVVREPYTDYKGYVMATSTDRSDASGLVHEGHGPVFARVKIEKGHKDDAIFVVDHEGKTYSMMPYGTCATCGAESKVETKADAPDLEIKLINKGEHKQQQLANPDANTWLDKLRAITGSRSRYTDDAGSAAGTVRDGPPNQSPPPADDGADAFAGAQATAQSAYS